MNGDLAQLVKSLPEDKKAALVAALEKDTGVTVDKLTAAAKDPDTAGKLSKLAGMIDPAKLSALADDPAKLSALLKSPQVKTVLRQFTRDKNP